MQNKSRQEKERELIRKMKRHNPKLYEDMVKSVSDKMEREEDEKRLAYDRIHEQGYISGWRSWQILATKDSFSLQSLQNRAIWPPYEKIVAECRAHPEQPIPHNEARRCFAGLYATKVPLSNSYLGSITGKVKLWGRYDEGEIGYRAEFAYPETFEYIQCTVCNNLRPIEGSQARLTNLRNIAFVCRDHTKTKHILSQLNIPASFVIDKLHEAYGLEQLDYTILEDLND